MRLNTREMAVIGLLGSLACVATLFFRVPGPFGYYHIGDSVVYMAAVLFGPVVGAAVGAIGSGVADIVGGYAIWAPWSLIIKGLTGYVVGTLSHSHGGVTAVALSMAIGAAITVAGYGVATYVMYSPEAVLVEVYGNLVQTGAGIVLGLLGVVLLGSRLKKYTNKGS